MTARAKILNPADIDNKIACGVYGPVFGEYLGIKKLTIHSRKDCKTQFCPAHNPSDHRMVTWDLEYRMDSGMWERSCRHGVGHPDPDNMPGTNMIHGCDGCCSNLYDK